jgi:hypothetical protein
VHLDEAQKVQLQAWFQQLSSGLLSSLLGRPPDVLLALTSRAPPAGMATTGPQVGQTCVPPAAPLGGLPGDATSATNSVLSILGGPTSPSHLLPHSSLALLGGLGFDAGPPIPPAQPLPRPVPPPMAPPGMGGLGGLGGGPLHSGFSGGLSGGLPPHMMQANPGPLPPAWPGPCPLPPATPGLGPAPALPPMGERGAARGPLPATAPHPGGWQA